MASQTTSTAPWEPIQENVLGAIDQYSNLVNQGAEYFPGSTVASQSSNTQAGTSALAGAAIPQSDILKQSNQAFNFASGDVLNPDSNPYLQAHATNAVQPVIDQLMKQILPGIGSAAVGAGGFGGTAHANLKQNAIADAVKSGLNTTENIYSNAYGQNLQAYMQALGMTPTQLAVQAVPAQTQLAAGGLEDQYAQAQLNDQVNRHNFDQTAQMDILDNYLRTLQGYGSETKVTEQTDSLLSRIF